MESQKTTQELLQNLLIEEFQNVSKEKGKSGQRLKYLNRQDKQLLFREIYKDESPHRKRNIAIFEVSLYCALRVSEITNLDISDYNPTEHTLYCHRLKGSNSNTLKIVDQHVIKALEDYLSERLQENRENTALFISQKGSCISRQRLDALMKFYCQKARYIHPDKWHMHVLKHTRAIDLAEAGCDIDDIKYWLGHKNVANTFIYLEFTTCLHRQLFKKLALIEHGSYDDRY